MKKRRYHYKNPSFRFFCPLCRAPREFLYPRKIGLKQICEIGITSAFLIFISWPYMEFKSLLWPIVIWTFFEMFLKLNRRKEVPCPECGFDATWYKKDVIRTRELVKDFWAKSQMANNTSELIENNQLDINTPPNNFNTSEFDNAQETSIS